MAYRYDVFISYKRYGEWTTWARDVFKPVLEDHLSMELGRKAEIFVDSRIEGNANWLPELCTIIAESRTMVPLFSKMYFGSAPCIKELYAMRHKETQLGMRLGVNTRGVITPARIHDGLENDLPGILRECCQMQTEDLTAYALTSLHRGSKQFLRFETAVKQWIPRSVVPAIRLADAHPFDQQWAVDLISGSFHDPGPADFSSTGFTDLS